MMEQEHETGDYGFETAIDAPLDEAVARVTAALAAEGFGVLTAIDVRAVLRDKLGVEFEPYVILGACNPDLAWRGLHADHDLGLLLPCNVIVHQHGDRSTVAAVDPEKMLAVAGDNPALRAVAEDAAVILRRVIDGLGRPAGG